MQLVQRIDGLCDVCRKPFIERAYTLQSTEHVIAKRGAGEIFIQEKTHAQAKLCPQCYSSIHANMVADR